ncbi:FtsX-like permease family protein [Rhodocytophaga rosea]|uniref:FtsX-like permease family protein n=1 Tax=Rhodocytophaga rosea TaxID=2704465 RepID=A0A6C0GDF5_9BACT|nr:ABC transporter permease [Rhodocytophaga rosea]QHT65720.1 FtsX-like permease family protein [Rhodocytophaga rosea]
MLKSYFKTALRSLLKHKAFSFINIFGLAIGMAACLLILQYVTFELSYDQFHAKKDRIFRLQQNRYDKGELSTQWAAGAAGIGNAMKEAFPEVETVAKFTPTGGVISYGDKKFREEKMYFANNDFFTVFTYPLVKGNPAKLLTEPFQAVISRSVAKKYFGNEDPVGKRISRNQREDYLITGVAEDMPENTHLKFTVLLSFPTFVKFTSPEAETTFDWDGFYTYILLKPGVKANAVEAKIPALIEKKVGQINRERNHRVEYKLQPVQDIHLYSSYMMEAEANGNGESVYFLFIIAFFIIIIAWINYINLSTARALDRAKEVGIRKVMGSYRKQLIGQFMFESVLVNLFAVLVAFGLVVICLPVFNWLTDKQMGFSLITRLDFWLALLGLFAIGSILSGLYPAFVLSSFQPIAVLKGRLSKTSHGAFLRQTLVVGQFAASVALMVGTFCVFRQIDYMQNQELGVQINQTLVLRGPNVTDSTYSDKLNSFKNELLQYPGIKKIAASTEVPGKKVGWNAGGIRPVGSAEGDANQYRVIGIDYDFLDSYGLKVVAGRNFSREFSTDPKAVLMNEAAAKLMGFKKPEEALNKRIEFWGETYTIVGVVANHHQESLREDYDVHIFRLIPDSQNYYSLKLEAGGDNLNQIINTAQAKWGQFFPGNPFEYFFLDEQFDKQYKADKQFGQVFGVFAVLAIFVACLGLFGLASFVTTQRTKEIGIRKVLGASISSILMLLSKDFVKLVVIAFVIASPITYYLLKQWLENYAFQASISPWMFIVPGLLILIIALLTVSTQTVKAATDNPVKSLRSE